MHPDHDQSSKVTAKGRVLIVSGSDSGGGAGMQADIKAVTIMGGYAASCLTALTVQNTKGVSDILDVPTPFIAAQMEAVLSDIGADALKTGMLHKREVIETVVETWERFAKPHMIVDPVMIAKGGASLLKDTAIDALLSLLVPAAYLLTPNMPEAGVLIDRDVNTLDDMKRAADKLMDRGARAVLVKGGHGHEQVITDLLAQQSGFSVFESRRQISTNTHGTGCTLASAIAALVAQGQSLEAACPLAIEYVQNAIKTAPGLGSGHGPLNHMATLTSYTKHNSDS
jgi:hydroxymethylpyrimidine/phosphomethylpyrimidine kinase